MNRTDIQKHSGIFRYEGKDIGFMFWVHSNGNTLPDTVICLGAGQVGRTARWVAADTPPGTIVIEGAPHWEWEAHHRAHDIASFMAQFTLSAFNEVRKRCRIASAHVIAESQAAPAAILLARLHPDKVRNLVLIGPLGFSVSAYGDTPMQRLRMFKKRNIRTAGQFLRMLMRDPRFLPVIYTYIRAMLSEPNLRTLGEKYAFGLSYDVVEDCRQAAQEQQRKGATFTILSGDKDRLFPPREILSTLETARIEHVAVRIVPGVFHSSLALRNGRKMLRLAMQAVKSGERDK